MSLQNVNVTELDGALGVLPSGVNIFALTGPADAGPIATPATFARISDVQTNFSSGALVEAACYFIKNYGQPVLLCRTTASTAATFDTINVTGVTGTSVVTKDAGATVDDDYDVYVTATVGGTIATAGIQLQYSLDGGRTLSPPTALGTANTFIVPGSGGVKLDFAAGTLLAGDVVQMRTHGPNWSSSDLTAALTALANTQVAWDVVYIVGNMDSTIMPAVTSAFNALPMSERSWIGSFRMPLSTETEATYLTAVAGFAALADSHAMVTAGAARTSSGISGHSYRRRTGDAIASLQAFVSPEIDISNIEVGSLPGVSIYDSNGNPVEHDESLNPGLDDARFTVLRTYDNTAGVYVNNPNTFAAAGSDFQYFQLRRIMNLAKRTLRLYFRNRLSKPVIVNAKTGFILETEALEIESGARSELRSELSAKPMVSAVAFTLSRLDNVLSTKTLTGHADITPLAYPKTINLDVGFFNPALQVVKTS